MVDQFGHHLKFDAQKRDRAHTHTNKTHKKQERGKRKIKDLKIAVFFPTQCVSSFPRTKREKVFTAGRSAEEWSSSVSRAGTTTVKDSTVEMENPIAAAGTIFLSLLESPRGFFFTGW